MLLELNEVLLEDEPQTLSLMAWSGRMTCLTGGTPERLTRWLRAMMGFETVKSGYVSIDGEPITQYTAPQMRQLMAYAPARLAVCGEVVCYEPPSVQDVFSLRANRELPISNGILAEEVRRVAADTDDPRASLLAVALLRRKPILLIDDVLPGAMGYLRQKATEGVAVVMTSMEAKVMEAADKVIEIAT